MGIKNFLWIVILVCCCKNLYAQQPGAQILNGAKTWSYIKAEKNTYYPPGFKMKRVGSTLTILGGALIVGGIITIAQANKSKTYYVTSNNTQSYYYNDQRIGYGTLMILGGLFAGTPGFVLWRIGVKRYKYYEKMQQFSFNLKGAGLSLKLKL